MEVGLLLLDPTFWTLLVTVSLPVVGFLLRKRIGRFICRSFIEFVRDEYFEVESVTTKDGQKRVLRRPNALAGRLLSEYVPGFIAWATANVRIKLPPFELPEGVDLKTAGMSALASKVMSGKKLKLEDAIPLGLGYAKEWLEKSGLLQTLGTKAKPGKELTSYWTEAKP